MWNSKCLSVTFELHPFGQFGLLLVTPITCFAIRVVDASASATALRGSRHWSSGPRSCGASCAGSACCGACPCRGGGGTSSSSCGCSGCLAVMVGMPLSFLDNKHNEFLSYSWTSRKPRVSSCALFLLSFKTSVKWSTNIHQLANPKQHTLPPGLPGWWLRHTCCLAAVIPT